MATLIRDLHRILMTLLVCGMFLLELSCSKPGIQTINSDTPKDNSQIIDLAQWDNSQWNWIDLKSHPREELTLIHMYEKIPFMPSDHLSADYILHEPYYLFLDLSNSITCIHTENMHRQWEIPFELLCNSIPVQSFQFLSMRLIEQDKVLLLFHLNDHIHQLCLSLSSGKTLWRNEIRKEESKSQEIIFSNQDFLVVASKKDQGIDSIIILNSSNGQEAWIWKENLSYVTCVEQELLAVTKMGDFVVKRLTSGETLTPLTYTFQSSPYAWKIIAMTSDGEFTANGLFLDALQSEKEWVKHIDFIAPENELRNITSLQSTQNIYHTSLLLFSYEWQDTLYLSYCDLLSMKELWKIPVPVFKPFTNLNFLSSSRLYTSNENSYLCLFFEDNSEGNDAEKASLFFINSSNGKLEWTIHSSYHAQLEFTPYGLCLRYNSSTQNSFYYFDRILMLEPANQQIIWNLASSNGIFMQNHPGIKLQNLLLASTSIYNFKNLEDSLSGYLLLNLHNGQPISVFPKKPIESIKSSQNSIYLTATSDKHIFFYDDKDQKIIQYELPIRR